MHLKCWRALLFSTRLNSAHCSYWHSIVIFLWMCRSLGSLHSPAAHLIKHSRGGLWLNRIENKPHSVRGVSYCIRGCCFKGRFLYLSMFYYEYWLLWPSRQLTHSRKHQIGISIRFCFSWKINELNVWMSKRNMMHSAYTYILSSFAYITNVVHVMTPLFPVNLRLYNWKL